MTKAQHTTGPWFYDGPNTQDAHIVHVSEGEIAQVFSESFEHPQAGANARLIAAAPELLETLQNLKQMFVADGNTNSKYYRQICTVLAKATGAA